MGFFRDTSEDDPTMLAAEEDMNNLKPRVRWMTASRSCHPNQAPLVIRMLHES